MVAASIDPAARGNYAVYRDDEVNHCPGCGRTNWLVGRTTAECAFCTTALPLKAPPGQGGDSKPTITERGRGGGLVR